MAPIDSREPGRGGRGSEGGRPPGTGVDCFSCRHFTITYDPSLPYGCRVAGFKSRRTPSQEMFAGSGIECQFFAEKRKKR